MVHSKRLTDRKPGRKPGFSFGRPNLNRTLRIPTEMFECAAELATPCQGAADILRLAITLVGTDKTKFYSRRED